MPSGAEGILLVSGSSTYSERQELASCILSAVRDSAQESADETSNGHGWSTAYLVAVAKGLLDSMDFPNASNTRGGA